MRSVALIIVLIAAHFTGGHAQVPTFDTSAGLVYPSGNTAAPAASSPNGVLIKLVADTGASAKAYSWVVSKPLSTSAISDFYVTVICGLSGIDIGPIVGATQPTSTSPLIGGSATGTWSSDFMSVNTIGAITGSTTTDQYIIMPGQTVRYTFDPTGSGTLWSVKIRDVNGYPLQKTPCNPGGVAGGSSTKCGSFIKASGLQMGFESLNTVPAIICVQTPTQWASGNSCDAEASKYNTCTGTPVGTYTITAKCTANLYMNACVTSCPAGTYAYGTAATAGCVDCGAALTTNYFCASGKTVVRDSPPTSSSALLRVGQIAAIFVGSIYFVLFA